MRGNLSDRFWAKVDKSGECWLMGSDESMALHREHPVSRVCEAGGGPRDNRLCVRPDHLSLGTHRDNMDQMVDRLRHTHGMAHHSSRLTEDDVRVIRRRIAAGDGDKDIASDYGVTPAAIFLIRSGKNWKWLDAA